MNPYVRCCLIPIKDIKISDISYRLRPLSDNEIPPSLDENIRAIGILHPPLILKSATGYIILSGRKRIEAGSMHGMKDIPCFVVDDTISPSIKWRLLLSHAVIGSTLSIIEQANFFAKAKSQLSKDQTLNLLPLVGYKPHRYRLKELAVYRELDQTTIDALHNGTIPAKSGHKVSKLSGDDQKTIVWLIQHYKLGGSKQNKLFTFATDLTRRTRRSLKTILSEWEEQQVGKQDNRPQQATALLNWLEWQCFPKRNGAEQEFLRFQHDLQLPKNTVLQHTPSFEDKGLTLCLSFADQDDFINHWKDIKKIL